MGIPLLEVSNIEYFDTNTQCLEKKTSMKLCIYDNIDKPGILCKRDIHILPNDVADLRASEEKKRPRVDFMEKIQKEINPWMRAKLIDWLVEVAEEYRLVPETLYLSVNCIDRYLSGNVMDRHMLQLLGVTCMLIASKYEEVGAPVVEDMCYITDDTYNKDEVLKMEHDVLDYLKFELTTPTTISFLSRFVRAAQGRLWAVDDSLQLECLANFVAELSLLDYDMVRYLPSLTAASAIFLAKYILLPTKRPWNSTLRHYTQYEAYELYDCVLALRT